MTDHIHQIRRIGTIEHREVRIEAQVLGVEPQDAADLMM